MKQYTGSLARLGLFSLILSQCQTQAYEEPASIAGENRFAVPLSTPFPDTISYPQGMPSEAEIALGRALFFDTRLSRDGQQSCSGCHDPSKGFSNGRPADSAGHRNPPHLYNLAWTPFFYWDGRSDSLEKQGLEALVNPNELHNISRQAVVDRLKTVAGYQQWFSSVFGNRGLSEDTLVRALASYERSLISNNSPFDQYLNGNKAAMSPGALRGLVLFQGKALCVTCHHGPNLTDSEFHNTGVSDKDPGFHSKDRQGPRELGFTPYPFFATTHAFKTPGLRNVALSPPYFHDGSAATLEDVVEFYNKGSNFLHGRGLARHIQPLSLSLDEKRDLVEFMQNLTSIVDPGKPKIP
jgi:cytochrome c peroxidase